VLAGAKEAPSARVPDVTKELDAVVMKALATDPAARYQSALEMAVDLERTVPIATTRRAGEWLGEVAKESLEERARYVADVESKESLSDPDIQVAVDGEPPTKILPTPASTREPGSVSHAVLTAETVSTATPSRRSLRAALIGIGAAAVVVLAFFLFLRASHETRESPRTASAGASPPPSSAIADPTPAPPDTPTTPTTPTTPATPTGDAPTATKASPAKTTRAVKPPPARTGAAPAAAKCDPPYTVDAKGVRVPKRECF
jgi:serine/threonine-protein kinase